MTEEVFYKKVGRKYIPVSYYDSNFSSGFPEGCTLITKTGNSELRQYKIDPAFAPMIAAGKYAYEEMVDGLHAASEARPVTVPITQEEADAWEHMKSVMGDGRFYLQYHSLHDIANVGIKALEVEAEKMMTYPAIKEAYEQFLMVCKLCKDAEK